MVSDARLGPEPVPFGFCNDEWRDLVAKMQPGDELWEWEYSDVEEDFSGREGFTIVRNGTTVDGMRTWVSWHMRPQ